MHCKEKMTMTSATSSVHLVHMSNILHIPSAKVECTYLTIDGDPWCVCMRRIESIGLVLCLHQQLVAQRSTLACVQLIPVHSAIFSAVLGSVQCLPVAVCFGAYHILPPLFSVNATCTSPMMYAHTTHRYRHRQTADTHTHMHVCMHGRTSAAW